MSANAFGSLSLLPQPIGRSIRVVVGLDMVHTGPRGRPLPVEGFRDGLLASLVAATVTEEHDVEEPMRLEAASGELQDLDEVLLRQRDRSRKPHVSRRRVK
jgi:hypothetical protein